MTQTLVRSAVARAPATEHTARRGGFEHPTWSPAPRGASRRVRRNRLLLAMLALLLAVAGIALADRSGHAPAAGPPHGPRHQRRGHAATVRTPLDPDWAGDGKAVTLAFGGDVNFPDGSVLGGRLADDPSSAMGPGASQLLGGVDLSMVNFESALTDGSCPDPQPKEYNFYAPQSSISAFKGAGVTLVTEANNHGEDCGAPGLQMALAARTQSNYPILGIGQNVDDAFTPYRTTIDGQRIVIIAATQVIDSDLQQSWTATDTQAGLASAYDVPALIAAVESARKTADTVIVFLHWGVELQDCPDPLQEPLATALVKAGADVVIGSHAHVLLGGGYLGSAYVDYGLGNFAFYNDPPPTDESGSLVITVTGRHVDSVTWRPALIEDEIPVPLTGADADQALANWNAARSCTDLTPAAGAPLATTATETEPASPSVVAPLSVDG